MKTLRGLGPIVFATIMMMTTGATAAPTTPQGSRVSMTPPEGFAVASSFTGFQGPHASILIVEIPGAAFEAMRDGFTADALAKQGVTLESQEPVTDLPFKAHLFRGQQALKGMTIKKWLLLADGGGYTAIINVSSDAADPLSEARVRAALATVRLQAAPVGDPLAALPFSIRPAARFTRSQALGGRGLVLMQSPPPPDGPSGDPGLTVTLLAEQSFPPDQRQAFTEQGVRSLKALRIGAVHDSRPIKVGEVDGWELSADAVGTSDNRAVRVWIVTLFSPKASYMLLAMAAPDRFDAAVPDFRATIESFRPKL